MDGRKMRRNIKTTNEGRYVLMYSKATQIVFKKKERSSNMYQIETKMVK